MLLPFVRLANARSSPPTIDLPQTAHYSRVQRPLVTHHRSTRSKVSHHPYGTVIYRKTPRPPAEYSSDVGIVMERCRADGGEEDAISLLPDIFSNEVSEKALTRKMTREEARNHHSGSSPQVYRVFLRSDKTERFHCRLCAIGANENGWKKPRDVLRHLKRDHFGLGSTCILW